MPILNAVDPTPEQIADFLADKKNAEPVFMLNLLKFKDRATYTDRDTNPDNDVSGAVAYGRYAKAFGDMVKASGIDAAPVFGGAMNAMMIGTANGSDALWDAVGIFRYPNAQAMIDMVSSDAYRKIHKHRRAGLDGQLLIACDDSGVF